MGWTKKKFLMGGHGLGRGRGQEVNIIMKVPAWRHKFQRSLFLRPAAGGARGMPPMLTINTNIFVTAVVGVRQERLPRRLEAYMTNILFKMCISIFIFLVSGHAVAHRIGGLGALRAGRAVVARRRKFSAPPPSRPIRFSTTTATTCWQLEFTHIHSKFVDDIVQPHHFSST